jgi:class 3 adenylate cyclase/TolB-like protein/tetratricopeptide (TPR) repeat protein
MVDRRLVAILCADIAGFSRLAERDETRTHARLAEIRSGVFDRFVAAHAGRTVKSMGDGLLVEFPSATSAVRCAVDIQRAMAGRNAAIPEGDRIVYRIGLNLGDVIVDGDDIFGDGVNVAARLEALAEPGAIAVSANLWEHVREDVGVEVVDGGDVEVKSIERPIHVLHLMPRAQGASSSAAPWAWRQGAFAFRSRAALATAAIVLALAAAGTYRFVFTSTGSEAQRATTGMPRSMVLLPFTAPGADSDAKALATALSSEFARLVAAGMRDWRVAEPASSTVADVRTVAREANARYVVAGELQRSGGETSLTVRVVDGTDLGRIAIETRSLPAGSERSQQSATLADVVRGVRLALENEEARRVKAPDKPQTADEFLARAKAKMGAARGANAEPVSGAVADFDEALRRDPAMVSAWIGKADALLLIRSSTFGPDSELPALDRAIEAATLRAVELDPRDPRAWDVRTRALIAQDRWEAAFDASDQAMHLDPADATLVQQRALLLVFVGRPEETLRFVEAQRARDPALARYTRFMECRVLLATGRYAEAIPLCERNASGTFYVEQMLLTALYANVGEMERAQATKARLMALAPGFTIAKFRARAPKHPDFVRQFDDHVLPGLRKAGVPEQEERGGAGRPAGTLHLPATASVAPRWPAPFPT